MTITTAPNLQIIELPEIQIAKAIPTLFRRFHLNRDVMIGLIGETGSGKSVSAGCIAFADYMVSGIPVYSNMRIKNTIEMDNYGIVYEAGELDRNRLLRMDSQYEKSCIIIDEINIKFAEARRASSNINLWYSDLNQQKRKLEMPIIYTVIDEMYVDPRVRNITDIFIRCKDTALTPHGLMTRQQQGVVIKWTIFDMKGKLSGTSYAENHQPLGTINVALKPFWGIIDTWQKQVKGSRKYTELDTETDVDGVEPEITEDPEVTKYREEWGWLESIAHDILYDTRTLIPVKEIYNRPGIQARKISQNLFSRKLNEFFGIESKQTRYEGKMQQVYVNEKEALIPV